MIQWEKAYQMMFSKKKKNKPNPKLYLQSTSGKKIHAPRLYL